MPFKQSFAVLIIIAVGLLSGRSFAQRKHKQAAVKIVNFDKDGKQVMRFSTVGDAIDAHDGEIAWFEGKYYLYGTSYDCGFEWGNPTAPFCGFKSYSSTDLVNWTDEGPLFDAKTAVWQTRCDGSTYGCFRPHVIYNKKTRLYVLWINVYDNVSGYRVFTSSKPMGPFTEVAEPKLGVNRDAPAKGLNNGDHDTFVDDDGIAYLAYTDWRSGGSIVIEQLSNDYLTGSGHLVKGITKGNTEAPALFKRNGIYYLTYSDPNCGYCSGTGTSYRTAKSPLGPWSEGKKISDNSCGGQPSFVLTIKMNTGNIYLYGSDLWNNAAKNEALANYFWAPLTFNEDGSIKPIICNSDYTVQAIFQKHPQVSEPYHVLCDVAGSIQHAQPFKVSHSGILKVLKINTFKTGHPDSCLIIAVCKSRQAAGSISQVLYTDSIPEKNIGWSARQLMLFPNVQLVKGATYFIVIKSTTKQGCYGLIYKPGHQTQNQLLISKDNGVSFNKQNETLKFSLSLSEHLINGLNHSTHKRISK